MLFIRMLCVRCWYAVSGVVFVSERLFRYSLRKTVRRDCQKRRIYIEALSISVLCAIVCILNGCVVFASLSLKYWEKIANTNLSVDCWFVGSLCFISWSSESCTCVDGLLFRNGQR